MDKPGMDDSEEYRNTLRRAAHDLNDELFVLGQNAEAISPEAALAIDRAHIALFEAWTYLCTPPEDEDDDHHD